MAGNQGGRSPEVARLGHTALVVRAGLLAGGLALMGSSTALYVCVDLGAGPRDSLMLVGARRLRMRIGVIRTVIELLVLCAGVALGGTVGLGTLAFACAIGPLIETSFWLLARSPLTVVRELCLRAGREAEPAAAVI